MFSKKINEEDKFGDIPFITFYSTVLSRLAYFTSKSFLPAYMQIFGPIIPTTLMANIDKSPLSDIFKPSIYSKTLQTDSIIPTYTFNGEKFINFTSMSERVNEVTNEFYNASSGKIPPKSDKPINLVGGQIPNNVDSSKGKSNNINDMNDIDKINENANARNASIKNTIKNSVNRVKNTVNNSVNAIKDNVINGNGFKVAYISISTSNYGGYYILVDTRMPNSIFVVFRGTYSAKSAGSYTNPTSVVPYDIAKNLPKQKVAENLKKDQGKMYGVLKGINKILDDVYHTIIESMLYLAETHLKPSSKNSIKVFTTGHSLGGGLCTLFAGDWYETTRTSPYNTKPYDIFSKEICCISIASPRVMTPGLANNFCQRVADKQIFYKRITNRGDPVPALPPKGFGIASEGYEHPCSGKKFGKTERNLITMDCGSAMEARPVPKPVYTKPLECRSSKTSMLSGNISGNALAHTVYLYVNFVTAVPVSQFLSSSLPSRVKSKPIEIQRTKDGATVARIILGTGIEKNKSSSIDFKTTFFNLNQLRPKDKQILVTGKDVPPTTSEDTLMNKRVFSDIIESLKPIEGTNYNPVTPTDADMYQLTDMGAIEPSPVISGIVLSGGMKRRHTRKIKKSKQTRKVNKNKRRGKKSMKERKSRKN